MEIKAKITGIKYQSKLTSELSEFDIDNLEAIEKAE